MIEKLEISEIHRIPGCPISPLISLAECRGCKFNEDVERDVIYCNCQPSDILYLKQNIVPEGSEDYKRGYSDGYKIGHTAVSNYL
jgi:hypothetical protein